MGAVQGDEPEASLGALRGAWAAVPSPVLIGHFVTQKLKFVLMRLMGWWHYDLERFADSKYEVRVERARIERKLGTSYTQLDVDPP